MKKIVSLLLSILFILTLASCEGESTEKTTGENDSADESLSYEENESGEPETPPATIFTDGKIARGVIEDKVFTNTSTGVRFRISDSWQYLTDEEIANKFDISLSLLDRTVFENTVAEMSVMYDMVAIDTDTNAQVVVAYENIALTYGKDATEEEYFEELKKQLESTVLEITFSDKIKTERLNGNTYKKMETTNTTDGYSRTQTYYVRPIGDYFCTILITTIGDNQTSKIESMFS